MTVLQENIQFSEQGNFTPKGKIKIELFDAETGKKTAERTKHNYVKQDVVDYATMMGRYKNFENTGSGKRFFDSIVLTDAAHPTQPLSERIIQGNVTGLGIIRDQASNTLYGAWNQVESVLSDTYYKLVFDFPTSSANGTFQSIYTVRKEEYGKSEKALRIEPPFDNGVQVRSKAGSHTNFYTQGGYIYRSEGKYFYKYAMPENSQTSYNTYKDLIVVQEYVLPFTCYGYTIKGNDLYMVDGSYKIYKAPLTAPSSAIVVKTFTSSEFGGSAQGIEYIAKNNVFAIYSASSRDLYLFSSDFTTKMGQATTYLSERARAMYVPRGTPNILVAKDTMYDVDTLKEVSPSVGLKYSDWGELSNGVIFYNGNEPTTSYPSNSFSLASSSQFFSRVLLDAPVTKTSQNTMKITYEFNIPPVELATF